MVVVVPVKGALSAGRHFVVAQAEVDRAVSAADKDALGASHSATLLVLLCRNALPFKIPVLADVPVQNAHGVLLHKVSDRASVQFGDFLRSRPVKAHLHQFTGAGLVHGVVEVTQPVPAPVHLIGR